MFTNNINFPLLYKYLNSTGFWCAAPFSGTSLSVDGKYSLCCISKHFSTHVLDTTISEYYNSIDVVTIQKEMLSEIPGKLCKEYCYKCLLCEDLNIKSRRKHVNEMLLQIIQNPNYSNVGYGIELTLQKCLNSVQLCVSEMGFSLIDLKIFGNLCNLKCIMCGPLESNIIAGEQKTQGLWDGPELYTPYALYSKNQKSVFLDEIIQILQNTHTVRFTGGEPFLSKDLFNVFEVLQSTDLPDTLNINITTNGTIVSDKFTKLLNKFKNVTLGISIDAYGDINDLQRRGSSFKIIDKNIDYYKNYTDCNINITATVTPVTCSDLTNLQQYSQYKLNKSIYAHVCVKPDPLSIVHLPDDIKDLYIAKFKNRQDYLVFSDIVTALTNGKYNKEIFFKYLNMIINLYGKDKILKYFPEYKPYLIQL